MKIVKAEKENNPRLGDLTRGDIFEFANGIYIKTKDIQTKGLIINCINLGSGEAFSLTENTLVIDKPDAVLFPEGT